MSLRGHDSALRQPNLPGLFTGSQRTHRLATAHDIALHRARLRLTVPILLLCTAFCIISGRITYLSTAKNGPDNQILESRVDDAVTVRADITDRNGNVLATSLPTVSLCADTRKLLDIDEAVEKIISALPDLDEKKLSESLHNGKACVAVKRHLTPRQQNEVNQLGVAGLEFIPDERRVYPAGSAGVHVVGFTNIDNDGLAGIERSRNTALHEMPQPVALSIDLKLQNLMQQELGRTKSEFNAEAAAGLIMDAKTGEILSMVSLPDFNPQKAGRASDAERFNRVTLGVYEMGSTFKIFNSALALNSGLIRAGDSFDATRPIKIGRFSIRDFHPEDRWLNVAEILVHSSNIGSALMAERVGAEKQKAFFASLGLMEKLKLEIPEIGSPLMPKPSLWNDTTVRTASFGHGIAVNAVQMAGAVATLLNDGVPVQPTLLRQDQFDLLRKSMDKPKEAVVSKKTSAQVRGLMRLVVTRGTGKSANIEGYMVGGKTGTADKIDANGRYDGHKRMSSFIGAFPMNDPRYIVYVLLDDPKGTAKTSGYATGGIVAAPLAGRIIAQTAPLLNITPMNTVTAAAAEKQLMKPLGSIMVDGIPVQEGLNYASVAADNEE